MKDFTQKTIENLLEMMNFSGQIEAEEAAGEIRFNIETDDAPLLIGQGGENLLALQQIVRKIVEKKEDKQSFSFIIDVNNYRKHKIGILKEMVRGAAKKVLADRRPTILQAMNAFERRVVHTVLADYSDLITESQGEEPNRRVIIKPLSII